MTTTTERRAVEVGDVFERLVEIDSTRPIGSRFAIEKIDSDGAACWGNHSVSPEWLLDTTRYRRIDIPAAAPLAADRTGCLNYCGWVAEEVGRVDALYETWRAASGRHFVVEERGPDGKYDGRWFCTEACRDAKYPPLAAQPADRCNCTDVPHVKGPSCKASAQPAEIWEGTCRVCDCPLSGTPREFCGDCKKRQPAPQPAPAKLHCCAVSEGGYACACHSLKPAVDLKAAWMAAQTGTPYTGPARIERPKLAHSAMWADEAEDVR